MAFTLATSVTEVRALINEATASYWSDTEIENWIKHPVFSYLIPDPSELEEKHGMKDFSKRFNPLNYYTPKQYLDFIKRDIKERTNFLEDLFKGQEGEEQLKDIINIWKKFKIPSEKEIKKFYDTHYKLQIIA